MVPISLAMVFPFQLYHTLKPDRTTVSLTIRHQGGIIPRVITPIHDRQAGVWS